MSNDVTVNKCDECLFDFDALGPHEIPSALRSLGNRFSMRISNQRADAALETAIHTRPGPRTWSALEYACHVRDVLLIQRERLYLALVEDCPNTARLYPDARATLGRYASEEPGDVARQLTAAADLLAWAFDGLDGPSLDRRCVISAPEPHEHTIAWLGLHSVHEGEHHLHDIDAALRSAAAAPRLGSGPQELH
jgi:S-DNA-T family DNA segregation ATPase FtsK/SpoIIIE